MDDVESLRKYNDLYLEVIMQNKDKIEEEQKLYVAELPKLVTPSDESVAAKCKGMTSRFSAYNYDRDFPAAAGSAYEYVQSLKTVDLPIEYWLKPSQVIKYGAGDVFDKAVLLCSLLIALGNVSTKVVILINENDERTIAVYCEFNGRVLAMETEKGSRVFPSIDAFMASLGIRKDRDVTAYEFNDRTYSNLV